jgi:CTP synthase (UTP-ammonia lyase)
MERSITVGIIGDFDPEIASHPATNEAIKQAASSLSVKANVTWLPTPSVLTRKGQKSLGEFDCLWASSGSPYESGNGMIKAIRFARKSGKPFFAT